MGGVVAAPVVDDDELDVAGAEIASYSMAGEQEQTGIVLFGVHEWMVTLTLDPLLTLSAGTYHIAIYADTVGDSDSWFWEVGNGDPVNGGPGSAFAFEAPGAIWNLDPANDFATMLTGEGDGTPAAGGLGIALLTLILGGGSGYAMTRRRK